jgi:hypothetical protein
MVSITLSVPEELKHKMDEFSEINWSAVAREAFMQKMRDMEFLREFKSRSKMTERDALELGRKVNKAVAKRFRGMI